MQTLEIIDYFKPRVWIVENVGTGLLVQRMGSLRPGISKPTYADYCAYGKPYRKRTVFWSSTTLRQKLCAGVGKCESMTGRKHNGSCGNGTARYNATGVSSVWEKDAIPDLLIDSMLAQTI